MESAYDIYVEPLVVTTVPSYFVDTRTAVALALVVSGGVAPYTYLWAVEEQPDGGAGGTWSDPTAAAPDFAPDYEGTWVLSCQVSDSSGQVLTVNMTMFCGVQYGQYRVIHDCNHQTIAAADWRGSDGEKTASDGSKFQAEYTGDGTVAVLGPNGSTGTILSRNLGSTGVHLALGVQATDCVGYDESAVHVFQAIVAIDTMSTAGTVGNSSAMYFTTTEVVTDPFGGSTWSYIGIFDKTGSKAENSTAYAAAASGVDRGEISATLVQNFGVQIVQVGALRRMFVRALGAGTSLWDPSTMPTTWDYNVLAATAASVESITDPCPGSSDPTFFIDLFRFAAGTDTIRIIHTRLLQSA